MKNYNNKSLAFFLAATATVFGTTFAYMSTQTDPVTLVSEVKNIEVSDIQLKAEAKSDTDQKGQDDGSLDNLNPGDRISLSYKIKNTGEIDGQGKSYIYLIFNNKNQNLKDTESPKSVYGENSNFIESVGLYKEGGQSKLKGTSGYYNLSGKEFPAMRYEMGDYFDINSNEEIDFKDKNPIELGFDRTANKYTMNQSLTIKTFTGIIQKANTSSDDLSKIVDDSKVFRVKEEGVDVWK